MASCTACVRPRWPRTRPSGADECAFVPSRWSCASVEAVGEIAGREEAVVSGRGGACRAAGVRDAAVVLPVEWARRCERNGLLRWDAATGVGGAACDCVHGARGAKCELCAPVGRRKGDDDDDDDDASNEKSCGGQAGYECATTLPEPNAQLTMSCACAADSLCSSLSVQPSAIDIRVTPTSASRAVVSIEVDWLAPVAVPSGVRPVLQTPYVFRMRVGGCVALVERVPCPGDNEADEPKCRAWRCGAELPQITCPPPTAEWTPANVGPQCNVWRSMLRAPLEIVCRDDDDGLHVSCSLETQLLPHGNLALQCDVGRCVFAGNSSHSDEGEGFVLCAEGDSACGLIVAVCSAAGLLVFLYVVTELAQRVMVVSPRGPSSVATTSAVAVAPSSSSSSSVAAPAATSASRSSRTTNHARRAISPIRAPLLSSADSPP